MKLRVAILSTHDVGGAGRAMHRLHRNLLRRGIESSMAVMHKGTGDETVFGIAPKSASVRFKVLMWRMVLRALTVPDYYFQDQTAAAVDNAQELIGALPFRPDAIIMGWISHFLSPAMLGAISAELSIPVIWYPMDMAPFTGGCHYAWRCDNYRNRCGCCPALRSRRQNDLSGRIWRRKSSGLSGADLTVVAASDSLSKQCARSALFKGIRLEKAMLSVDPDVFSPGDKVAARRSLGIPEDGKVILVGSLSMKARRKGMRELIESVRLLDGQTFGEGNLTIAAIGGDQGLGRRLPRRVGYLQLGVMPDDRSLAECYRAADLFLCPSIEDSGPMMINEAVMSGTPVACFDVGVARDLAMTGETGYRAVLGDAADLARGAALLLRLSPERRGEMSERCRQLGLRLCHPEVQADFFSGLLKEVAGR